MSERDLACRFCKQRGDDRWLGTHVCPDDPKVTEASPVELHPQTLGNAVSLLRRAVQRAQKNRAGGVVVSRQVARILLTALDASPPAEAQLANSHAGDDASVPSPDVSSSLHHRESERASTFELVIASMGSHFATMHPAIAELCILAGSRVGDTVLDPFGGAGTTGLVADRHARNALLIELNPEYAEMARKRICNDSPLFNGAA